MPAETAHESPPLIAGGAVGMSDDGEPYLLGSTCRACGTPVFPPVAVCPECLSEDVAPLRLGREGQLYSFSTVHVAPKGWRVPYIAGYVDLPEGVRVFSHVVGALPDALAMDMPVRLTVAVLGTDADGEPFSSYAFTPVNGEGED